jgi:hypothetical protein
LLVCQLLRRHLKVPRSSIITFLPFAASDCGTTAAELVQLQSHQSSSPFKSSSNATRVRA